MCVCSAGRHALEAYPAKNDGGKGGRSRRRKSRRRCRREIAFTAAAAARGASVSKRAPHRERESDEDVRSAATGATRGEI